MAIDPRYIANPAAKASGHPQTFALALVPRDPETRLNSSAPFWTPDRHARRRHRLLARARIIEFVRRWFDAKGFVEVDPAALQVSPGNETHLHGFQTTLVRPDGSAAPLCLQTSPEFAMKKLIAAGESQIFALTHVFRNRERTALHAPEFAMLEWYRTDAPLARLMDDCAALVGLAAHAAGARAFAFRGREASPFEPPERVSVREAFLRFAGIDLFDSLPARRRPRRGAAQPARTGRGAENSGRRHVVGPLQPHPQRARRALSRDREADDPAFLSSERSGAGPIER